MSPNGMYAQRYRLGWRLLLGVVLLVGAAQVRPAAAGPPGGAALPLAAARADPLVQRLDTLLVDEAGVYGVVVMAPDGRLLYSRNRAVPFVSASLYKLVVMAAVYEREASGELSLAEPLPGRGEVADALHAMIVWSDNGSAKALLRRLGGIPAVNQTAARLGLAHTRIDVDAATFPSWPARPGTDSSAAATDDGTAFVRAEAAADGSVDVTTPRDVARFFRLLLAGRVVSPDASAAMLALLGRQGIRDRLPALLPAGTAVAHKTGDLPRVIHDAGVIATPVGPVIVVALAEAMPSERRARGVIQRLGLIVYEDAPRPPRWQDPPSSLRPGATPPSAPSR